MAIARTHLTSAEILRHGKQAHAERERRAAKEQVAPEAQAAPAAAAAGSAAAAAAPAQASTSQAAAQAPVVTKTEKTAAVAQQPNYREEAEKIVAEEKAQGDKMPKYDVRADRVIRADASGPR